MTTNADAWLREYLTQHGETSAVKVHLAGADAGYTVRTLQRTLHKIDGTAYGRGPNARWSLPTAPTPAAIPAPSVTPSVTSDEPPPAQHWRPGSTVGLVPGACPECGGGGGDYLTHFSRCPQRLVLRP